MADLHSLVSHSGTRALVGAVFLVLGACSGTGAEQGPAASGGSSGAGGSSAGGTTSNGGSDTGGTSNESGGVGGTGAVTGSGGTAAGGTGGGGPVLLNQADNPIYDELSSYQGWLSSLSADIQLADNILTWQMPHGGFYKFDRSVYDAPWSGGPRSEQTGEGGVEIGTIDNDATVRELLFLADVYGRTSDTEYRDGARAALDFLLTMQYPSGGFPQVYPARTGATYSNHVTFNDNAMVRVLAVLLAVVEGLPPLGGDLATESQRADAEQALEDAVDFILDAQIVQGSQRTVWCAQHDPVTYEPRGARSYELPSKSGKESAGVVAFLMTRPQTSEIKAAVQAALAWYRSPDAQLENTAYVSRPSNSTDDNYNPIQSSPGSTMWCRFYDLDQDVCFFSGRLPDEGGTGKQYDIMLIEPERRYGYQWGGNYGGDILSYAAAVGY